MPNFSDCVFGIYAILLDLKKLQLMPIEQQDIDEAREILGDTTKNLTDDQLKDQIVMVQFLIESWMDEFEKEVFRRLTLKEVLNDG